MKLHLYRQIEALVEYADNPVKRVGTGISKIDAHIRGPAPGEVCMIVGRSYTGKSIVGQNIIANNPTLPSIFFSMEMPFTQALLRLYAIWADEPFKNLQEKLEEGETPLDIYDLTVAFPYHVIIDQPNLTLDDMSDHLQHYEASFNRRPEFIVIDYLELLGGAKRSGEGYIATEQQATMLKDWAKTENMRVYTLHQSNKTQEPWEPPTADSPRNGGFTEADFVVGAYRPHLNPKADYIEALTLKNKIYFNVLKNRAFGTEAKEIHTILTPSLRIEERTVNYGQAGEQPVRQDSGSSTSEQAADINPA